MFQIAIPWALRQLGVAKWLRERALRVPESVVAYAAAEATLVAGTTVTVAQWRAVESVQARIIERGIETGAGGRRK